MITCLPSVRATEDLQVLGAVQRKGQCPASWAGKRGGEESKKAILKIVAPVPNLFQVRFGDFTTIPKLIPPLKALFADDIVEMEERKEKREQRLLKEAAIVLDKLSGGENEETQCQKRKQAKSPQEVSNKKLKTVNWKKTGWEFSAL